MKVIETSDLFAELFVTSVAMLESDYESEFVMATRLLEKVTGCLDLTKTEQGETGQPFQEDQLAHPPC